MQNQSVSLSQYYQYGSADRNGLRHCRVACNVVAIASLKVRPIAVASCNDYTASCNDKEQVVDQMQSLCFFGRLVPPADFVPHKCPINGHALYI